MKTFKTVRQQYAIVGITDQSTQSHPFDGKILVGFLLFGCIFIAQTVYIYRVAVGFIEYMVCISSFSANFSMYVCFAAVVCRKDKIFECADNIEQLIDANHKYPESEAFMLKTIRQVERLSEIIFTVVMKVVVPCVALPACIFSYCVYFIADAGHDSFQLPFPLWFPFDSNNPIGYSVAFILEYILWAYEAFIVACTLSLAIGAYWFVISATAEMQRLAPMINGKAKAKTHQSDKFKLIFTRFIDNHGIVKKVVQDFSDIFQPMIMLLFTWSLLAISGAMLVIQLEIAHHDDFMTAILMILCGITALTIVFIACELGQRMSNAFDDISSTIDRFDWYSFPIEMKRMLPMVIANAQQPVTVECFGSIACTRDAFKKVLHRAYSYFMVLRQLGA